MSTHEDRPTIGERYSTATESSNLKLSDRRGDVDLIIAAGLMPDGLAGTMYRLQCEYDRMRGEHMAAEERLRFQELMAQRETGEDDETGETAEERSEKIIAEAQRRAVTEHLLILMHLTSLRDAKEEFGRFALQEANRRRLERDNRAVAAIAGRVLDVWLRPKCHACDGVGTVGGSARNDFRAICRPCKGSGHRRDSIGKDDAERAFAGRLLMETDAMMAQAARDIRTGMNRVAEAKEVIGEATR